MTVSADRSTTVSVIFRQEMFLRSGPCSIIMKPGSRRSAGCWAGGAGTGAPLRRAFLAALRRAARFMPSG